MNMRFFRFFVFFLLAMHLEGSTLDPAVYEDSSSWPAYVEYTGDEPIAGSRQMISPGTRGTLIRMEANGALVIDFGREGLASLDPGLTNFARLRSEILEGTLDKPLGNALFLLGPRTLSLEQGRWVAPEIEGMKLEVNYLLLLYADATDAFLDGVNAWATSAPDDTPVRRCLVVLLDEGPTPERRLMKRLEDHARTLSFVRKHLVRAYTNSLAHDPSKAFTAVLIDADGKLMAKTESDDLETFDLSAFDPIVRKM